MRRPGARASGAEVALLVSLTAWGLFPVVLLVIQAVNAHARLTGADGLIGADGVLGADQLQYLAWARDAGSHVLASDLFSFIPSGHVYLEPVFAITGALWKIGVPLQVAYLIWKPIAALALFAAAFGWAGRTLGDGLRPRVAVLALSLFLYTPLAALFNWAQLGSGPLRFQLYLLATSCSRPTSCGATCRARSDWRSRCLLSWPPSGRSTQPAALRRDQAACVSRFSAARSQLRSWPPAAHPSFTLGRAPR